MDATKFAHMLTGVTVKGEPEYLLLLPEYLGQDWKESLDLSLPLELEA